jgi:hypothetical protein
MNEPLCSSGRPSLIFCCFLSRSSHATHSNVNVCISSGDKRLATCVSRKNNRYSRVGACFFMIIFSFISTGTSLEIPRQHSECCEIHAAPAFILPMLSPPRAMEVDTASNANGDVFIRDRPVGILHCIKKSYGIKVSKYPNIASPAFASNSGLCEFLAVPTRPICTATMKVATF